MFLNTDNFIRNNDDKNYKIFMKRKYTEVLYVDIRETPLPAIRQFLFKSLAHISVYK